MCGNIYDIMRIYVQKMDKIGSLSLQDELIEIHKEFKKTILSVTHDIQETIKIGTISILLNNRKFNKWEAKKTLYLSNW